MKVVRNVLAMKRWREQEGLSQREIADLTGIDPPTLSRMERGLRDVSPRTRVRFARAVGATIADVFGPPEEAIEVKP